MAKVKNTRVKQTNISKPNKKINKNKDSKIFVYAILIAILTIIVFSDSIRNYFVNNFDDIMYISSANNAKALIVKDIGTIFSSYVAGIYHPLTLLSLTIEINLFGTDATHFHLVNLVIHIFNVLLVFWFIYLLTKRIEICVIVALFFGIHPMHVESVSWISERKDVLYTLFFLGSLIAYLKYLKDGTKYKYLCYSVILFLLSLLSKSAAVCLAPIIVLIDYYLSRKFVLKTIIEKVPYFLLAIIFGIVSLTSQSSAVAMSALSDFKFSFIDRILLVSYSVMFYIIKALAPFYLSAIHYYPLKIGGMLPIEYYLAPIGIAFILFLIIKFRKIRKELIFGFLFYLISIFFVLQFIPVGYAIVSERYSYVPYIGLFFIAGKLYCDFADNKFGNYSKAGRNYIIFFVAIISLMFSYLTYERNKIWKNDVVLFDDVINKNPEVGHCYWARGNAKYELNNIEAALCDYNIAIEHNYKYADVYDSRAKCYFDMDSIPLAIESYTEAIKLDNKYALAYYNRAHARQKLMDYIGSIDDYKKAIENNIDNIGFVYNEISFSQMNLNDLQNALISVNKAIELDPDYASEYIINKAKIEYLQNNFEASLQDYNRAIESNPNSDLALFNRGLLKIAMKDTTAACKDFSQAAELGYAKANDAMKLFCR